MSQPLNDKTTKKCPNHCTVQDVIKRVVHRGGIYSLGSIIQSALSFFLIPLYTTYLDTKDYGMLALLQLTISLIIASITSPFNNATGRFYYHPKYEETKSKLLGSLFIALCMKTMLFTLLFWLGSDFLCRTLFNDNTLFPFVRLYTFVLLLTPIASFFLHFLRLQEKAVCSVGLSLGNVAVTISVIVVLLVRFDMGIYAMIYGKIAGLLFQILCGFPFVFRAMQCVFSISLMNEPLRYSYPLIFTGYSLRFIDAGDRYIINAFHSTHLVGIYSFAYALSDIVKMIFIFPVKHSLHPLILQQENNPDMIRHLLAKTATYYYGIGIFLCLGISLFCQEAIILLASQSSFWDAWVVVPLITFANIQHGLGNFLSWGMVFHKKSYHLSGIVGVSALFNLGLNVMLVPVWGIQGAAVATLLTYILWNGLKAYFSFKYYQLSFEWYRIFSITALGILLYAPSLLLDPMSGRAMLGKSGLLLAYPFFVLIVILSSQERRYLASILQAVDFSQHFFITRR